jgi:EAL domain-containing protein (putative c-di-GMP-specific phosphodiesterase class I)
MVQADKVLVEVTETALVADIGGGIASLHPLQESGVRIAIADFGTGCSSLSTLPGLPVDILKIDGSFVSGQTSAKPSVPMLEDILRLTNKLSLAVVAEGIEGTDQLDLLRRLGCSIGQRHLLAWPASAQGFQAVFASGALLSLGPSAEVVGGVGL